MMLGICAGFGLLAMLCAGLQLLAIRSRKSPSVGNNPTFLNFQRSYFAGYFPALLGDWLQGPYLYKLYSHYGFSESQIAVLYAVGIASTVLLGTWAPIAADQFGRQKLLLFFTVCYSLACFMKLSWSYGILLIGRILGGVATSLLFSSFEAWYVHEHVEKYDFPKEWLSVTFSKATVWNGALAVAAGIVANIIAESMGFGPVSPFILAVPCFVISGIVVLATWPENHAKQKLNFGKSCSEGLRTIMTEPKIFLIGIIQSLFESVMYIFIFIWTPVLHPYPGLGVIFSSFMLCIMIGSAVFQLLVTRRVPPLYILLTSVSIAFIGNAICVMATHPESRNRVLAYFAFLIFQVSVGMYFPSIAIIRSRVVPEAQKKSIMNWFRVPLNLIACVVLMMLHNDTFRHGNRLIFVTSTALLGLAGILCVKFITLVKNWDRLNTAENTGEINNTA